MDLYIIINTVVTLVWIYRSLQIVDGNGLIIIAIINVSRIIRKVGIERAIMVILGVANTSKTNKKVSTKRAIIIIPGVTNTSKTNKKVSTKRAIIILPVIKVAKRE